VDRDFVPFRTCNLFLLTSSDSFSSLIFFLLLFSSLILPTSGFQIVGSLTSKLPSIVGQRLWTRLAKQPQPIQTREDCNAGPVLVTSAPLAEELRTTVASLKRLSVAGVDISDWVLIEYDEQDSQSSL
jgi:hypothetical protein